MCLGVHVEIREQLLVSVETRSLFTNSYARLVGCHVCLVSASHLPVGALRLQMLEPGMTLALGIQTLALTLVWQLLYPLSPVSGLPTVLYDHLKLC